VCPKKIFLGDLGDKVVFRVLPNYGTAFRQLARYGQGQALWVFALSGLAAAFLLVQAGALVLALRVTRRMIAAIEGLSRGAAEISRGNLAHRVAARHSDQLGLLATSFNDMAQSIERLMAEAKENERQEQEILLARRVQESLFPRALPKCQAWNWPPLGGPRGSLAVTSTTSSN
jgi:nitrogen fixation/metabolism regulation signal transduction histidine kinase